MNQVGLVLFFKEQTHNLTRSMENTKLWKAESLAFNKAQEEWHDI